jgi:hypothetical protein
MKRMKIAGIKTTSTVKRQFNMAQTLKNHPIFDGMDF